MWNLPWVLSLAMPFGLLPPRTAQLFWLLAQIAVIVFSADRFWTCFGGEPRHRPWVWGLSLAFYPVMYIVFAGQSSAWLLLGMVGLLLGSRSSWEGEAPAEPGRGDILSRLTLGQLGSAGVSPSHLAALLLPFAAIKPHLFLPIGIAFLCEAGRTRRGRTLLAMGLAAGLVAVSIPTIVNPDVWQQYLAAMNRPVDAVHSPLSGWKSPLIGYWARAALAPEAFWIQTVPTIVVAFATSIYWWFRRANWDWRVELPRLVLAGLIASPYGAWSYDQIVLLVPIAAGFAHLLRQGSRGQIVAAFFALGIVNGIALTIRIGEHFVWLPAAFALWYACVISAVARVTPLRHSRRERVAEVVA